MNSQKNVETLLDLHGLQSVNELRRETARGITEQTLTRDSLFQEKKTTEVLGQIHLVEPDGDGGEVPRHDLQTGRLVRAERARKPNDVDVTVWPTGLIDAQKTHYLTQSSPTIMIFARRTVSSPAGGG